VTHAVVGSSARARGCRFSVGSGLRGRLYVVWVQKQRCWNQPGGSVIIGETAAPPALAIAGRGGALVASFTTGRELALKQLAPTSGEVTRAATVPLIAGGLKITAGGDLQVSGTKRNGEPFKAVYPGFAAGVSVGTIHE
jgi:hypothetical protein